MRSEGLRSSQDEQARFVGQVWAGAFDSRNAPGLHLGLRPYRHTVGLSSYLRDRVLIAKYGIAGQGAGLSVGLVLAVSRLPPYRLMPRNAGWVNVNNMNGHFDAESDQ